METITFTRPQGHVEVWPCKKHRSENNFKRCPIKTTNLRGGPQAASWHRVEQNEVLFINSIGNQASGRVPVSLVGFVLSPGARAARAGYRYQSGQRGSGSLTRLTSGSSGTSTSRTIGSGLATIPEF